MQITLVGLKRGDVDDDPPLLHAIETDECLLYLKKTQPGDDDDYDDYDEKVIIDFSTSSSARGEESEPQKWNRFPCSCTQDMDHHDNTIMKMPGGFTRTSAEK